MRRDCITARAGRMCEEFRVTANALARLHFRVQTEFGVTPVDEVRVIEQSRRQFALSAFLFTREFREPRET
jgi:hypothetical protein